MQQIIKSKVIYIMKKYSQIKDDEILLLYRRGKYNKVMKIIMNKFGDTVYSFIIMMVKNEEDANDLSQDTFIKVFKNLNTFNGNSKLSTWIISIAKNTTYSFLKNKNYIISRDDNKLDEQQLNKLENQNSQLPQMNILNSISFLSQKLKTPIVMYYYANCSYDEISKIMNVSTNTIKAQIRRAKIELNNMSKKRGIYHEL
ncbi:MAG: sigma-70 family RNA polymerase sigma factor [Candidatus Marinimicrobia bacterium]|nr:sigma-70 family RNA polymerase sigma factor [Candidatus Neomarinimicrobiota bacterium]